MTESNPARILSQRVKLPDRVPAFTLIMQCASGLAAPITGAQHIATGSARCVLVAAMESMSGAQYTVDGSRWGLKLGHGRFTDSLQECKLAGSKLWHDPWDMIDVAEHHARVDGITRDEMDEYAVLTHIRAVGAIDDGRFRDEMVPIELADGTTFDTDEHPAAMFRSLGLLPSRPFDQTVPSQPGTPPVTTTARPWRCSATPRQPRHLMCRRSPGSTLRVPP
jgi:acetyl-CoA C-acetyltransferase